MNKFFRYLMPIVFTVAIISNFLNENYVAVFWVFIAAGYWGLNEAAESQINRWKNLCLTISQK
jgi:hypothetical protein